MARDYYGLLGVGRDAGDADIKRAYRRLARELHPDVNPDEEAQHRFKEITIAYEVLSDPEKRRIVDLGGDPLATAGAGNGFAGFGGLGAETHPSTALAWKGRPITPATTIAMVATDAKLTKPQAKRLAIAASGGKSKGLRLAHAIFDGDMVFAASTGRRALGDPAAELIEICALASDCLARAIARGVHAATALPFAGAQPAWRDRFGSA